MGQFSENWHLELHQATSHQPPATRHQPLVSSVKCQVYRTWPAFFMPKRSAWQLQSSWRWCNLPGPQWCRNPSQEDNPVDCDHQDNEFTQDYDHREYGGAKYSNKHKFVSNIIVKNNIRMNEARLITTTVQGKDVDHDDDKEDFANCVRGRKFWYSTRPQNRQDPRPDKTPDQCKQPSHYCVVGCKKRGGPYLRWHS